MLYNKYNYKYNLTPLGKEYKKTQDIIKKLNNKILESQIKVTRLKKQRKFYLKKLKEIGDYKAQNTLKLEADEGISTIISPSSLSNPFSLEQFQLPTDFDQTIPLGSTNRTPLISQDN